MSTSLFWQPPPSQVKEHSIDLKYEIANYLNEDYNGESCSWEVGKDLIPFLKGIIAGSDSGRKKDAQNLIDAIEKYGTVILIIH